MATMIDLLGAQSVRQNTGGVFSGAGQALSSGVQTGIQLAQAKQQAEVQKQNLQAAKQDLEQKKMMSVANRSKQLMFAPDAQVSSVEKSLRTWSEQSQTPVDIDGLMAIRKDPQTRLAAQKALNDLTLGKVPADPEMVLSMFSSSPELFKYVNDQISANSAAQGDASFKSRQLDVQEKKTEEQTATQLEIARLKTDAAKAAAEAKASNKPTVFQEARDRAAAKTSAEFIDAGGYAGIKKSLSTLDTSLKELDEGRGSGGVTGFIPQPFGSTAIKDLVAPAEAALQQNVLSVMQSSMRATLGAQFTENEGKMILERAFNPRQSPKENAKRVRAVRDELEAIAKAKQAAFEYAEENGTLKGYKGPTSFTIDGVKVGIGGDVAGQEAKPLETPGIKGAKALSGAKDKAAAKAALAKRLGRELVAEEIAIIDGGV